MVNFIEISKISHFSLFKDTSLFWSLELEVHWRTRYNVPQYAQYLLNILPEDELAKRGDTSLCQKCPALTSELDQSLIINKEKNKSENNSFC